jgi:hypothetical protein
MAIIDISENSSNDEPRGAAAKRPYERPSFRFEQVFVTSALSCGKVSPSDSNCRGLNSKVS